jgi:hypothetical protein
MSLMTFDSFGKDFVFKGIIVKVNHLDTQVKRITKLDELKWKEKPF